jgi:hypothetical protein
LGFIEKRELGGMADGSLVSDGSAVPVVPVVPVVPKSIFRTIFLFIDSINT